MNQILARNLVWNKNIKFLNLEEAEKIAQNLLTDFQKDQRVQYCIFSIERGSEQSIEQAHFQGYLEFNRRVDARAFNKIFNFNYFSLRQGTQQQAIDYVKKPESKLSSKLFQFGQPKNQRFIGAYNNSDPEIPNSIRKQETLINRRLKNNYYPKFENIEKDFEHIFIKQSKWLKELWNRYHPVEVIDEIPAKTIWIYGPSSSGKTTWTKNFFRTRNITSKQICKKKASNSKRPKLWFELGDEDKKFLWIEEIRENFPDFNDIIQLIDKGTRLEVKGSHVI